MRHSSILWPASGILFVLWTLRILYLPSPITSDGSSFLINTSLRMLLFLCPFLLATVFVLRKPMSEVFALTKPTRLGMLLACFYLLIIVGIEFLQRQLAPSDNPWLYLNLPFAPVIEELVFRGFIFTLLQKHIGSLRSIVITALLFTLIHFPGWIFLSQYQGEAFIVLTGQVFLFGLIMGSIRSISKSVYPSIIVHIVNNLFMIV